MIASVWENITPVMAAEYLKRNTKNRPLRHGYVVRLSEQMKAGEWQDTHQGVAFYEDGVLGDGQHRLSAIVMSGTTQRMLVTRGLKPTAALTIDSGIGKNEADAFNIVGVSVGDIKLDQRVVSMVRSAMAGMKSQGHAVSRSVLLEFIKKHSDAIAFVLKAMELANSRWPFPAAVMAPCMRAYYTVDRSRLAEFIRVLSKGTANGEVDFAAVTFRNLLLMKRTKAVGGSGTRTEMYRKCESALRAFLEYRSLSKIYSATQEEFPLPEETE